MSEDAIEYIVNKAGAAERSDYFNSACWAKRTLRTLSAYRQERRQGLRLQKALEGIGLARADLVVLRAARTLPILPDPPPEVLEIEREAARTLYRCLLWAERHADLQEQAALLGTGHQVILQALRRYGRADVLTLLGTADHPRIDPALTTALSLFMIETLTADPLLNRRATVAMNDILGTDLPLPPVPRPRLVTVNA